MTPMQAIRFRPLALAVLLAFGACGAAAQPGTQQQILLQGQIAGSQQLTGQADGSLHAEFSFNDRGRGDHIIASWKLDRAGVPTDYAGHGNDYMKAPIAESFQVADGKASWRSGAERGEQRVTGEKFYVPHDAPPEFTGVLARALLKAPHHTLALLPAGEAHLDALGSVSLSLANGHTVALGQYAISGLDFSPTPIWLDPQTNTAALLAGGFAVLAERYRPYLPELLAAQARATNTRSSAIAHQLTHVPAGDLLIRHARLFDPRDLSTTAGMSVLIRTGHIVRVGTDAEIAAPADAEVIDASGQFLMPGLWDNHQHFSANDGALDLANGVTSARDMANDTDEFLERVARFDAGTELGPRVFKAGVIDGKGPLAGPTRMLVENAAEAIQDVTWYADQGYGQIKIYSSVAPALVPVIANAAHARGLRVSGHVPAFMSARQFVEAGADEIQHLNFIVLNFLFDSVKDTRGMARFTAVAEHVRELGPESPRVHEFIGFLRFHHTVLDPTMSVFEAIFSGDPTAPPPALVAISKRFPPQMRRATLSGALAVPPGKEAAYRAAFPAMLHLLKALYDGGIPIIPGTDALAGYTLHHELQLYARAGIPAPQVLRMATLDSAHVSGAEADRGVIAQGKLADMILIDGDPAVRMSDLDRIRLVLKGGRVYDPARIERSLGIAPRP